MLLPAELYVSKFFVLVFWILFVCLFGLIVIVLKTHRFWGLKVGPHTCKASALPTEIYLQYHLDLAMSTVTIRVLVAEGHLLILWGWKVDN